MIYLKKSKVEKLELACREVIRAEAAGKSLPYLSEEVKSALSLRKAITKSVAHTVATKIS